MTTKTFVYPVIGFSMIMLIYIYIQQWEKIKREFSLYVFIIV